MISVSNSSGSPTPCSPLNRAAPAVWVRSSTPPPTTSAARAANIRETLIKLSAAFSALGDNSKNLFGTIKNLSILVSALQSSQDLMRNLNQNLAVTTGLLSDRPNELGAAISDVNSVVGDVQKFVADNRESLGTATDKIGDVSTTLVQSLDDIKQALHVFPNSFQNFLNIYQPSQGAFTGALAVNQLANPIQFLCGAIQAASRLGAEQSAKLCVQYLAPIIKNRQYNFLPAGMNPFVGAVRAAQRAHLQRGPAASGLHTAHRRSTRAGRFRAGGGGAHARCARSAASRQPALHQIR